MTTARSAKQCIVAAQVLHLPMAFFDTTPAGRLLNRLSKDTDTADISLRASISWWFSGASESAYPHPTHCRASTRRCWPHEVMGQNWSDCFVATSYTKYRARLLHSACVESLYRIKISRTPLQRGIRFERRVIAAVAAACPGDVVQHLLIDHIINQAADLSHDLRDCF